MFRVREIMLFSLKLRATRFSETWDKPEDFYVRLHEVLIFLLVRRCSPGRTYVPAYFVVALCRSDTFKASITKGSCAPDSELILQ